MSGLAAPIQGQQTSKQTSWPRLVSAMDDFPPRHPEIHSAASSQFSALCAAARFSSLCTNVRGRTGYSQLARNGLLALQLHLHFPPALMLRIEKRNEADFPSPHRSKESFSPVLHSVQSMESLGLSSTRLVETSFKLLAADLEMILLS